jgi:mannose-1-phosphate guanylyltransferase
MKAVVLIGGKGTRLRPITYTVPKAMVPLRNKPYIRYLVDALKAAGLDGAVLAMGYLPDLIQRYFAGQDLEDFSLEYVVESSALGTAGALKNAEDSLEEEGSLVVTNGDILTGLDLRELIEAHQGSKALATIALTSVEDPTAYGLVEVDHQLQVKRFVEKPSYDEVSTNLVNAGIYVLEREVLDMVPKHREVSIEREIFPELQAMGKLRAYISSAYWRDIGTPARYLQASHDTLSGAVGRTEGFEYLSIHPSALISQGVTLLPPVCMADDCEVRTGATVGGRTALGKRCVVEEGALVEGSVLFEGVRVGGGAVIRNAIVGPNSVVGRTSIVRGLCVLGAESVIGEGNLLDGGIRVNPRITLPKAAIAS